MNFKEMLSNIEITTEKNQMEEMRHMDSHRRLKTIPFWLLLLREIVPLTTQKSADCSMLQ